MMCVRVSAFKKYAPLLALLVCAASLPAQQFSLKNGGTVVFYGDSITAQRLYTRDVEEFILTRYPDMHLHFVNAGVPGDTAAGGYAGAMPERVTRDVQPFQPTMITVMLGMNDGGYGYEAPTQAEATFQKRYLALLSALHQADPDAAFTLMGSTPYDEVTHGTEFPGYSRIVAQLSKDVPHLAEQFQASTKATVLSADFYKPLTEALDRAQREEPQLAPLLVPDRIHPAPVTHWIMAAALVSAWHLNPVVSSVTLDAGNIKILGADRATVSKLQNSRGVLQWTQLDQALPLPLDFNDAMTSLLLRISNLSDLDRQMLRVESLAAGQYELVIDGKSIAAFSSEELRHGVNLALYKTPMVSQAREIDSKEEQRAVLDHARFILSADTSQLETSGIAEATLRAAQDDLDEAMRKHLSPVPHNFELKRVQPVSAAQATKETR